MISKQLKTKIYNLVSKIPIGKTSTYKAIAMQAHTHPRTVASVLKKNFNPISLAIEL